MNRKQFLWLLLAVALLGGASLAMFWKEITAYRDSGAKIGARLMPELKISDIARVRLHDADGETTLVLKDKVWRVEQRGGYPADFAEISSFILKLLDVKVLQSEPVGASLHGRLNLLVPGKGTGKDGKEGVGMLVELSDASGKVLSSLVLGKISLKKDPLNPLPNAKDGVPAGRHVLAPGRGDNVVVVSDPLEKADTAPGAWVARDFFKADRIRSLQLSGEGVSGWKIGRDEEWGQWKFIGGGGLLNPSAAVSVTNALGSLAFSDVVTDDKLGNDKLAVLTAETFDNLTYVIRLSPQAEGETIVRFKVSGAPPKMRKSEPKEKPEDKEKLDKDYAEAMQRLEARVMLEQARSQWAYRLPAKTVSQLLLKREQMVVPGR